jgi:hypothetical protein
MPSTVEPPVGFTTRPEAPKLFNRSQRALERELEKAQAVQDKKVLQHWKLITKDGAIREGREVSTDDVKKLQSDGMVPTWCVEDSYLANKYGRKGESKPQGARERKQTSQPKTIDEYRDNPAAKPDNMKLLPDDVGFLKERIRILEREKREEVERNENREAKLFAQLDVKDKQISAWDEITQGITKGLATGQITPNLLTPSSGGSADVAENQTQPAQQDDEIDAVIDVDEKPVRVTQPKGSQSSKKATTQTKRKRPVKKKGMLDYKWNEFPAFSRLLSRSRRP